MFIHHVYFWQKSNTPPAAREKLLTDCRLLLKGIPGVDQLWAGEPAGAERDVVDSTYTVGLAIVFPDRAAHDAYQKPPIHLEFIARNKAHWERVLVHDFIS